jgi:PAS domain-containing protein
VVRTDGEVLWVRAHQTMIADAGGKGVRMIAALYDVAEHKAAQQALIESESRFRSLAAMSSDWYWEQDADLRFSSISAGFFRKSAMTLEELLGKQRWDLSGAVPPGASWDAHRAVLEARRPFRDFEFIARRRRRNKELPVDQRRTGL